MFCHTLADSPPIILRHRQTANDAKVTTRQSFQAAAGRVLMERGNSTQQSEHTPNSQKYKMAIDKALASLSHTPSSASFADVTKAVTSAVTAWHHTFPQLRQWRTCSFVEPSTVISLWRLLDSQWLDSATISAYLSIVQLHANIQIMDSLAFKMVSGGNTNHKHIKLHGVSMPAYAIVNVSDSHWVVLGAIPENKSCVFYDSCSPASHTPPVELPVEPWLRQLQTSDDKQFEGALGWPWEPRSCAFPQQHAYDCSSCGIFALMFVQCHSMQLPHTYSTERATELRVKLCACLYTGDLVAL